VNHIQCHRGSRRQGIDDVHQLHVGDGIDGHPTVGREPSPNVRLRVAGLDLRVGPRPDFRRCQSRNAQEQQASSDGNAAQVHAPIPARRSPGARPGSQQIHRDIVAPGRSRARGGSLAADSAQTQTQSIALRTALLANAAIDTAALPDLLPTLQLHLGGSAEPRVAVSTRVHRGGSGDGS